jgi:hypothetical protein
MVGMAILILAIFVEMAERMTRSKLLSTAIPSLLVATWLSTGSFEGGLLLIAINYLSGLVVAVVLVYLYRWRGLASAWVAYGAYSFLDKVPSSLSLGDSSFALQANLILLGAVLLLALGAWGYVGEEVKSRLAGLGVR